MSDTNQQTIDTYETHVQAYIDGTPPVVDGVLKTWIDASIADLPTDARILEIGTAFGRDADYIEAQGYTVARTDVVPAFVKLLQEQGHEATVLDAINDEIVGIYDLIFADAVLLHFTREETKAVIDKVYTALAVGGRFAFSLKQGEGEKWSEEKLGAPRYFCYWNKDQVVQLLEAAGFVDVSEGAFDGSGHNDAQWLRFIVCK